MAVKSWLVFTPQSGAYQPEMKNTFRIDFPPRPPPQILFQHYFLGSNLSSSVICHHILYNTPCAAQPNVLVA